MSSFRFVIVMVAISISAFIAAAISDMWRTGHIIEAFFWLGVVIAVLQFVQVIQRVLKS